MDAVPDGTVIRGSLGAEGDEDETPSDEVFVPAFYIDRFEIANDQYDECVEAGVCQQPRELDPTRFGSPRQPVVGVSWYDAATFCQWAGKRLPTEAEWERAARGDDRRTYPWGDSLPECDQAVLTQCDRYGPEEVGGRPRGAGPFGTRDLAGNVWEWVQDWYAPRYAPAGPDGNPTGPAEGQQRVLRGGSWRFGPPYARVSNRHRDDPRHRVPSYGFRCAYRQQPPPTAGAHTGASDAGADADLTRPATRHGHHEPSARQTQALEEPTDADAIAF
jgi:formylglycine-generating enzyme required for sulfatase activity